MAIFELFGVPRLKAGTARVECDGATVGEALASLAGLAPGLDGTVIVGATLRPSYILSINGDRFVTDPTTRLGADDVLLLLSADVGG